jgi:hypothetical protein
LGYIRADNIATADKVVEESLSAIRGLFHFPARATGARI